MAVFKTLCILVVYQFSRWHCHRRPICVYYFLGSTGIQRYRLPVDSRGPAVTVTGRSQRTRIRSGIFDFRSVNLIQIRSKEPAPLFENNTNIYIYRGYQGYSNPRRKHHTSKRRWSLDTFIWVNPGLAVRRSHTLLPGACTRTCAS